MKDGVNDFLDGFFLASGTFRRLRGWEGSYNIGQFVTNQLDSCVDNMSKLYFIIGTDIAIPRDCVKR